MNTEPKVDSSHPMQLIVDRAIRALGIPYAILLIGLTVLSLLLVTASAFDVDQTLGIIVGVLALVAWSILTYLPRIRIRIISGNDTHELDSFTPLFVLVVLAAFMQTIFWVSYPNNINSEPRVAFIWAVFGFVAFSRAQYRKIASSQSIRQQASLTHKMGSNVF